MTTLTKEYFDQRMEHMDGRFDSVEKSIEDLAAMTARGFADLEKRLDVRERLETLEKKMSKVESALNVQL